MIGFTSIGYLSSTFVATDWLKTCIGQVIAVMLVMYFYCVKQDGEVMQMLPGLVLMSASCSVNSYYVEFKDK